MGIGQGVRTGFGHGGIKCVFQTQFSSFGFFFLFFVVFFFFFWGGGGGGGGGRGTWHLLSGNIGK